MHSLAVLHPEHSMLSSCPECGLAHSRGELFGGYLFVGLHVLILCMCPWTAALPSHHTCIAVTATIQLRRC